jgi:hypothetical protein
MISFESVLAFGDSHVAGCELANRYDLADYTSGSISIEQADASGKELAFPKIISDKLGIPCYNYAMSGGSNARSLRLLIQAVQQHPNSLVLFGYTSTDRSEIYYPASSLGKDSDNFLQLGVQWDGIFDSQINDFYIKNLHSYNNLGDLMFCVDSICTKYAIQHIHIPLFPEKIPVISRTLSFDGYNNYLDWCKAKEFKQMPFYHYGKDAHDALSELILKEL